MFARYLLPAAMLLLPLPCMAQAQPQCDLTDDQTGCTRVLACFGTEGRWFEGRAFGRGIGTVAGVLNDGVSCNGVWTSENGDGQGEAQLTCDDGLRVTVITTHQDHFTGTAIGRGTANSGVPVTAWSGLHVADFLRGQSGSGVAVLPCGTYQVPVS